MKREIRNWLRSFLVELAVYAVMVVGYFFLVLDVRNRIPLRRKPA